MCKPDTDEEKWAEGQRHAVEEYLRKEKVDHLGVGENPAFAVYPHVAMWAVQSKKAPGRVGWWAVSGDLPTDYISRNEATNPREVLGAFARRWLEMSDFMLRGEKHPDYSTGAPDKWPELGDLLKRRALVFQEWVEDDEMWEEQGGMVLT